MPLPSACDAVTPPRIRDGQEQGALANIHLVLFMTAGMSLAAWHRIGMFEREVALYRRLRPRVKAITIVSYGNDADLALRDRLPGIEIICNRHRLPETLYRWLISRVYPLFWRGNVVVKTNQTAGGEIASVAARTAGARFVARCGYMLSDFTARAHGANSELARAHQSLERRIFATADRCVITTSAMAEIVAGHGIPRERIRMIPNYVDTDYLRPMPEMRRKGRVGFVGRLDRQKNVFSLIEAMRGLDAELVIVGDGPHASALQEAAREHGVRADFLGRVPHNELPAILNSCEIFALPSLYEGHPKALLEAMACGLSVVGADVPGVREVLRHGQTGWLCDTDAASIAEALNRLLTDADLRQHLGRNAREEIVRYCSLDRVLELESDLLGEITAAKA